MRCADTGATGRGHFQAVSGNLKIGRFYALNTLLPFDLNLAAVPRHALARENHTRCALAHAPESTPTPAALASSQVKLIRSS